MKFTNQFVRIYDQKKRVMSNLGSKEKDIYKPKYDKNGVMYLEKVGKENIYEMIQSHKDSVDIHVLLERYKNGDLDVMSRVQGIYGDFTEMPKTYAESLNAMISAENYFNELPVDVRAEFGHSFQQFLASMDKPEFLDIMSRKFDKKSAEDLGISNSKSSKTGADPAPQEGVEEK